MRGHENTKTPKRVLERESLSHHEILQNQEGLGLSPYLFRLLLSNFSIEGAYERAIPHKEEENVLSPFLGAQVQSDRA